MKHEIIKWPKRILFPVNKTKNTKRLSRAVSKVIAETKPRSFCYCGRNCAVNRKHVAMLAQRT